MKTYFFTLHVVSKKDLEDLAEEIYEFGSDVTVASTNGIIELLYSRDANSLEEAIASAINDAKKLQCTVRLCSLDNSELEDCGIAQW